LRSRRQNPSEPILQLTVDAEFATVDAVVASGAETLGVDAFALSLIKAERQMRRLFTHMCISRASLGAGTRCIPVRFASSLAHLTSTCYSE